MNIAPNTTRTGFLPTVNPSTQQLQNPDSLGSPTVNVTGGGSTGGAMAPGNYLLKQALYAGTQTASNAIYVSVESAQFTVASGNIPQVAAPAVTAAEYPALFNDAGTFTGTLVTFCTQAGGASGTEIQYASQTTLAAVNMSAAVPGSGASPPSQSTPAVCVNTGADTWPALTWANIKQNR